MEKNDESVYCKFIIKHLFLEYNSKVMLSFLGIEFFVLVVEQELSIMRPVNQPNRWCDEVVRHTLDQHLLPFGRRNVD